MRTRYLPAAALTIAAALGVFGLPAAAQAASAITIVSAGNPAGLPSVLDVVVTDSAADVNSVTAQLTPAGGGTSYTPPALTLSTGTPEDGTWSVTIPSGAIAAGNYTISATATDTAANTATDTDAGTLAYLYQPILTADVAIATITYGNQGATFSGQLTAVPPDGGSPVGEGSIPVFYAAGGGTPTMLTTTQSDGTFSASVQGLSGGSWMLTTDATSTVAAAQSNPVSFGPDQADLNNIKVSPSHPRVGQTVTLTGTVNFGSGTGAVVNAPVQISDGSKNLPTVTTNASGNFTEKFPAADGGEGVSITSGTGNALLVPTSVGVSFPVTYALREKLFSAKIEGDGFVSSRICLLTSPPNFQSFTPNTVQLQYAPRRSGPWKRLGALQLAQFTAGVASCQVNGWSYYSDAAKPISGRLTNAYYRAVVGGNSTIESFTGPVVHSSINRSRIVSFNVSPRSVSNGHKLTVSGRLERHGKSWSSYAHQQVLLLARVKGQKEWTLVASARTNGSGHFAHSFTAGNGHAKLIFAALFAGNSKYLWTLSSQVTVAFNGGSTPAALPGANWTRAFVAGLRPVAVPAGVAAEVASLRT